MVLALEIFLDFDNLQKNIKLVSVDERERTRRREREPTFLGLCSGFLGSDAEHFQGPSSHQCLLLSSSLSSSSVLSAPPLCSSSWKQEVDTGPPDVAGAQLHDRTHPRG